MARRSLVLALVTLAGCARDVAPPTPPPERPAVAPTRGAAGNEDLRVLLAELASTRACAMIRGGFHGLRAASHPEVVTGVLWIRECAISNAGVHVTFHITGNGWLWVDQTSRESGGTFSVQQYVRFGVETTIRGALDIAYDRTAHVASVWLTPDRTPDVQFNTIGDIDVDREGVWSTVVGALGTALTTSPEQSAAGQAKAQGTRELAARLANGLAATVEMCTGLIRVELGRSAKGVMAAADVGETQRVPVEIQPGGLMIIGPQHAEDGLTLRAEASRGRVRLAAMCARHAETIAAAFMAGDPAPALPVLGTVDVRDKAALALKSTGCLVDIVVTPLDEASARFSWERPTSEIARATGGPWIYCAKPRAKVR